MTRNCWAFRSTGYGVMRPFPVTAICIFPLLSDFEPKDEVARKCHAYRTSEGVSERALFVFDRQRTIAWSYLSPIAVNPGADGILDALEKLSD
jgi:peroxiredoxin